MNTPFFFENLTKDLENYQRAVDAHSIVAITDARGVITHVNDKFCDISQYSYAELMGARIKLLTRATTLDFFSKNYGKPLRAGTFGKAKFAIVQKMVLCTGLIQRLSP